MYESALVIAVLFFAVFMLLLAISYGCAAVEAETKNKKLQEEVDQLKESIEELKEEAKTQDEDIEDLYKDNAKLEDQLDKYRELISGFCDDAEDLDS